MPWQDPPHYRDRSRGAGHPLLWLFSGSVPLFTAFGVRVRAHAMFVALIAVGLIVSGTRGGLGVKNSITASIALILIVLLHEFGHCLAAWSVGGDPREILLWPLGGLAYADSPQRAWPQFFTAAGGPLVNVVICLAAGIGLMMVKWDVHAIPWNPFVRSLHIPIDHPVSYYLWWVFIVSWVLLLFNLLPIFPLDGGRLLHSMLWFKFGSYFSTLIVCTVGMVGSVLMAGCGIMNLGTWYGTMFIIIGASCFIHCFTLRAATKSAGPWELDGEMDYSSSAIDDPTEAPPKRRKISRRAMKRARKILQRENAERQRIDAILAKVSAHGMQSLNWRERRALHKATEHQRQRDMELSRLDG